MVITILTFFAQPSRNLAWVMCLCLTLHNDVVSAALALVNKSPSFYIITRFL